MSEETSVGRPTSITPEVVVILQEAFRSDETDTLACILAGIDRSTYYRHFKENEEFRNKMLVAQSNMKSLAKKTLAKDLSRDSRIALAYLQVKAKDEGYAPRQELTGPEGTPLGYMYSSDLKKLGEPNEKVIEGEVKEEATGTGTETTETN